MLQNTTGIVLQQRFTGAVWKIETEEATNIIAVESREASGHSAAFSALNFATGECYFHEATVENSWWHGLDKVFEKTVFLHGYASEAGPEHKGIIALDLSGQIRWQQFNRTLESISPEGLIAYDALIRPKRMLTLSPGTGEQLGIAASVTRPVKNSFRFPDVSGRASLIPGNAEGMILKSAYAGKNIWSFHTKEGDLHDQHLLIEQHGKILFEDKLSAGIQKLNPEAFFIIKGFLVYIRNKNEIVSYSL